MPPPFLVLMILDTMFGRNVQGVAHAIDLQEFANAGVPIQERLVSARLAQGGRILRYAAFLLNDTTTASVLRQSKRASHERCCITMWVVMVVVVVPHEHNNCCSLSPFIIILSFAR